MAVDKMNMEEQRTSGMAAALEHQEGCEGATEGPGRAAGVVANGGVQK